MTYFNPKAHESYLEPPTKALKFAQSTPERLPRRLGRQFQMFVMSSMITMNIRITMIILIVMAMMKRMGMGGFELMDTRW